MISAPIVRTVAPMPIAAVRRVLRPDEIAASWRPALDIVWPFVRSEPGLWTGGHNVFVYQAIGPDGRLVVDFGVQVTRSFVASGEVLPSETPGGRVISVRHSGPIEGLASAYAAIDRWMSAHDEQSAGPTWETYGDWGPDPATHVVTVSRLLGYGAVSPAGRH